MNYVVENWQTLVELALQIVGAAAIVATLTPTDADNKVVALVSKLVHALGANFGKAKNGGK